MLISSNRRPVATAITVSTLGLLIAFSAAAVMFIYPHSLSIAQALTFIIVLVANAALALFGFNGGNWYFWFLIFFQVMYFFSTILSTVIFGLGIQVLDYATNFNEGVSVFAEVQALHFSLLGFGLLLAGYPLTSSRLYFNKLGHSSTYYLAGKVLVVISLPGYLYELTSQLQQVAISGYSAIYLPAIAGSPIVDAFLKISANASRLGLLLIFASMPNKRSLYLWVGVFVLYAFIDALKGSRAALIIPLIWLMYYWSRFHTLKITRVHFYISLPLIFSVIIFVWPLLRAEGTSNNFDITSYLVSSVSKGLQHSAVFIENREILDIDSLYVTAPLTYPYLYISQGAAVAGQSESAYELRNDLTHVMSGTLNFESYENGAGMGSAFVSESIQGGLGQLILVCLIYPVLMTLIIRLTDAYRILFTVQPLIVSHVIFAARDTVLPNLWQPLKFTILAILVIAVFSVLTGSRNMVRPALDG